MANVAAAIVIRNEKNLVAHFRQHRAVSADTAQSLTALNASEDAAFRRLRRRAVIREDRPGFYHLDEPSWDALRFLRRRLVVIGITLIILSGAVSAWFMQSR